MSLAHGHEGTRNLSRQSRRNDDFRSNPRPRSARVPMCLRATLSCLFFSSTQKDCVKDKNTYTAHTAAECVRAYVRACASVCACPTPGCFTCAVAAVDHKLAQMSLAIQSLQGREELAKTHRVSQNPALLILCAPGLCLCENVLHLSTFCRLT